MRYSKWLLLLVTTIMLLMFVFPVAGLFLPSRAAGIFSVFGICAMILGYRPTLKFYGLSGKWGLCMPLIGMLFLAMTWTSVIRCWQGKSARWKGRSYN